VVRWLQGDKEEAVRRRIATISIALLVCALVGAIASQAALAGDTTPPTDQQVDQLFVQSARHGTLTPTKRAGHFTLVLKRTSAHTQSIYCCVQTSDGRRITEVHQIPTPGFIGAWAAFGFTDTHPDAVLSLLRGDPAADAGALRLTHPRTRNHGHRVAYQARRIDAVDTNLDGFSSQLDRGVPRHFGGASLYISEETAPVAGGCAPGVLCQNVNGCEIQPYTSCPNADLHGADLHGADLTGADLFEADLSGADLSGADLSQASLYNADLSGADLAHAKLQLGVAAIHANLNGANLTYAYLYGVNLHYADLRGADLSHASLNTVFFRGADLSGADLSSTYGSAIDFTDANLTDANLTGHQWYGVTLCRTTWPDGGIVTINCR
jgi:uncharacterized protein YjbI with pentapeptide repeats